MGWLVLSVLTAILISPQINAGSACLLMQRANVFFRRPYRGVAAALCLSF